MLSKIFAFSKIERIPSKIEERINEFLDQGKSFKFSTLSESHTKGQFYVTLYYDDKKSNVRVKAFRDNSKDRLDKAMNEFLSTDIDMKFANQSSTSNNLTILIYYSPKKANDSGKEEENKDAGQTAVADGDRKE